MTETDFRRALGYIEANLDHELNESEIARAAYCSPGHFRRLFGIVYGIPLGEYIRRRRLSRAAEELQAGKKVLEVALAYGYETGEGFSRAFKAFHGVLPSEVRRGAAFRRFCPADPERAAAGEDSFPEGIGYEIKEMPAMTLTGFYRHFRGVPFGPERANREDAFYRTTRGKQWLLYGASGGKAEEYAVLFNFKENGYDYAIAYEADEWAQRALRDPSVLGLRLAVPFETFALPQRLCAVFSTEPSVHPVADYVRLRTAIASLSRSFELTEEPELVVYHWHLPERTQRRIEICLPVKQV